MKKPGLSISQKFKALVLTVFVFLSVSINIYAADAAKGEKIFNGNCASCHFPHKDMTGPALQGARQRWIDNSSEETFYKWVQGSGAVIASGDAYAKKLKAKWGADMPAQALTKEQIDDVFEYVETYVPPVVGPDETAAGGAAAEESSPWIWIILACLLITIIVVAVGANRSLQRIANKQDGIADKEYDSYGHWFRQWSWDNRGWFGVLCGIVVIILLVGGMMDLLQIGVVENYKPDQPIPFSHEVHAGKLNIDCKYCHNSATKSRHAGIPSVNVCMNCHKTVDEGTNTGKVEIAKIYEAAGWDAVTKTYTGETKPIEWIKVHTLPDHVYFNHSQHVVVGKLDCKNCHGNMKKEGVARVMTSQDLNNVGVTDKDYEPNTVKFTRPTLTMGWCIECHLNSSIDIVGAPEGSYYNMIHQRLLKDKGAYRRYLEDDVISVADLGGIECAKCHY